jgi:alkanesulfonate monooxygenase SsuD/methylene tetrahydromethanopterin reductase-like flavin-dependent oxidoreductase (luciferase family)
VLASVSGIEEMKTYRNQVRTLMSDLGRDPDSLKMLFIVVPFLADTLEEAQALKDRSQAPVEMLLCTLAALTEIDFSRGYLDRFIASGAGGKTLREVAENFSISSLDLVGTPDSVAAQMDEAMQEVGGDGFLISGISNRRQIAEITEGLVPELQRRGLTRTEYTEDTLRGNLFAF